MVGYKTPEAGRSHIYTSKHTHKHKAVQPPTRNHYITAGKLQKPWEHCDRSLNHRWKKIHATLFLQKHSIENQRASVINQYEFLCHWCIYFPVQRSMVSTYPSNISTRKSFVILAVVLKKTLQHIDAAQKSSISQHDNLLGSRPTLLINCTELPLCRGLGGDILGRMQREAWQKRWMTVKSTSSRFHGTDKTI